MKKPQNPSRSRKTPDLVKKPQEWERWFGAITMSYRYTTGSIRVVQFLIRNNVRVDLLYRANRNRSFVFGFSLLGLWPVVVFVMQCMSLTRIGSMNRLERLSYNMQIFKYDEYNMHKNINNS